MKTYQVTLMTSKDYGNMMNGGYNYASKIILIDAENAQEAVKIAKKDYPDMVVLDFFKKMECQAEEDEENASRHNMTVRQYKAYQQDKEKWERNHAFLEEIIPIMEESIEWIKAIIEKLPWMRECDPELLKKLPPYIRGSKEALNYEIKTIQEKMDLLEKLGKMI